VRATTDPDDADEPPFFDVLLAEALKPVTVGVGELAVTFEVPDGGQVGDLDDSDGPADVLEALLVPTDEDGTDERDEAALDELLDAFEHRPARQLRELADDVLRRFGLHRPPPAGWADLVEHLDRFGAGIEWDLLTCAGGLRLHDFVRDPDRNPWSLLYRVLPYLPQGGGYWAAVQADEQWAHDQLDAEERAKRAGKRAAKSSRPPLFGWTAAAERETTIIDTLRQGVHATWGASPKFKGKGGKPPQQLARPRNAVSWVRRARALAEHDEFVNALLPRGFEPPPDDALVPAYREDAPEPQYRPFGERLPSPDAVRGGVLLDPSPDDA
jgi:hypothetical protein